jgi:hypothetical protein
MKKKPIRKDEVIQLPSRYRDVDTHLIPVSKNKYKFYTSGQYYRFGPSEGNPFILEFIDPEGGPFIAKGYRISDKEEIKEIVQDMTGTYILTEDV